MDRSSRIVRNAGVQNNPIHIADRARAMRESKLSVPIHANCIPISCRPSEENVFSSVQKRLLFGQKVMHLNSVHRVGTENVIPRETLREHEEGWPPAG